MKKALCLKSSKDPNSYFGFTKDRIYEYYKLDGTYMVLRTYDDYPFRTNCCYDHKKFDEFFMDLQKIRNLKLEKLNKHNKNI
jgi:hypothetical protein